MVLVRHPLFILLSALTRSLYRNKYPGCRFDSESYSYGFSFSQEVLDEWDWSEHFAGQPEMLVTDSRLPYHIADISQSSLRRVHHREVWTSKEHAIRHGGRICTLAN